MRKKNAMSAFSGVILSRCVDAFVRKAEYSNSWIVRFKPIPLSQRCSTNQVFLPSKKLMDKGNRHAPFSYPT